MGELFGGIAGIEPSRAQNIEEMEIFRSIRELIFIAYESKFLL